MLQRPIPKCSPHYRHKKLFNRACADPHRRWVKILWKLERHWSKRRRDFPTDWLRTGAFSIRFLPVLRFGWPLGQVFHDYFCFLYKTKTCNSVLWKKQRNWSWTKRSKKRLRRSRGGFMKSGRDNQSGVSVARCCSHSLMCSANWTRSSVLCKWE